MQNEHLVARHLVVQGRIAAPFARLYHNPYPDPRIEDHTASWDHSEEEVGATVD